MTWLWDRLRRDPRYYQIAALTVLLLYGLVGLDFEVGPAQAAVTLAAALLAQFSFTRAARLPKFDPRSALISGLSLCLLLRTGSLALAVLTAFLAVGSKFILRWNGKHIFNPTNFGIVAMMLLSDRVWVSPGQWGAPAVAAFFVICVGGWVVHRAARSDVTLAFLASYAAILFGRAAWLGVRPAIPLHQLESGALLIFAFFMISDPKTTPDSRPARILFALLVAVGAGFVQFILYHTNGLLWSLAALSPIVPALDRLLPGRRYEWNQEEKASIPKEKGEGHEKDSDGHRARPAAHPREPLGAGVLRLLRRQGRHEAL